MNEGRNMKNDFLTLFSAENGDLNGSTVDNGSNSKMPDSAENEQRTDVKDGKRSESANASENGAGVVRNTASPMKNEGGNASGEVISKEDFSAEKEKNPMEQNLRGTSEDLTARLKIHFERVKELARGEYVREKLSLWKTQADELAAKYPDFKLRETVKDPVFLKLLKSGVSMDTAYKALNFDTLLSLELERYRARMLDDIRVRGMRPGENGLISGGGVNIGMGAMSFSRKERAEIARRVEKGEKIVL